MRFFGIRYFCVFMFVFGGSVVNADGVYAPLLDKNKASKEAYLANSLRTAGERMPKSNEVPVPAYKGASIIAVTQIPSVSESQYQLNRVIEMVTTDTKEKVSKFYTGKLSAWTHKTHKNGNEVLLKKGNQLFWGGNKFLQAPRVEVRDLSNAKKVAGVGVAATFAKKAIPELRTLVKIYSEYEVSDLLAIDSKKVVAACIEGQLEMFKKKMDSKAKTKDMDAWLTKNAKSRCSRVEKVCSKKPKGRFCQSYARKYP